RTKDSNGWKEYTSQVKRPSAFHQWVTHIQEGTTADENIELALELTKLVEASNLSARQHAPFLLNDLQE
ncbi:MAG TPA: gfo/Idh/MocA family oxidoreductase, partial [Sporolactobacillaceae bacterium]|nr:gfo/Idh/MocA family oxidoreductase [Sporolactobacillaceae bacterium]